jgi:serine/threonine kinase PknH
MGDTAQSSRVGSRFGRYHLRRLIGRGGMGEVYEAEDTVKERLVALKLLSPALSQDPIFRERLHREARTAGRLQDPHVVPVHDYGEIDGQLYLDMRLIDGADLSTLLKKSGALTPPRTVAIVRQAASALDAAHAAGVIHRDIKPENILITRDDFAYLVDFGIARAATDERLTQIGSAVGTWKYSAPERFTTTEVTPSVDVYSLACVLHECLTGAPPYRVDSAGMLITAHLMEPVPQPSQSRPGIPRAFDAVIARGMAKDPEDRYASAGDLALAANDALSAQDQDRAGDIVERSEKAALPATDVEPPSIHIAPWSPPPPMAYPATSPPYFDHTSGSERVRSHTPAPAGAAWNSADSINHSPADEPRPPPSSIPGIGWPGQFGAPLALRRRRASQPRLLAWAVALAAVVVVGVASWLLQPSHRTAGAPGVTGTTSAKATATTPVSAPPAAETQARLFSLLPAGYPPDTCKPIAPPQGALAQVSCGQNSDPDGPPSATYTLFPDSAALRAAFNGFIHNSTVVECPGRIQSPGLWHRNATPEETSGTLMCGTEQGSPIVGWTTDAELLIGIVRAELPGSTLDQLYRWWTSHS